MTAKVLESFGDKFAEKWVGTLLTPAFVFWLGGLATAIQRLGWDWLVTEFTRYPEPLQLALLVGALCVIAASAFVVQRFDVPVLRFLEGYWSSWLRPLANYRVHHYRQYRETLIQRSQAIRALEAERNNRFQDLKGAIALHGATILSPAEREEYLQLYDQLLPSAEQATLIQLQQALRSLPVKADLMPTHLGNLLRAAERQPLEKYGLDAIICWSRLWLLLPEPVKKDLHEARADLNTAARIWLWSVLFTGWALLGAFWAIPIGIAAALFAYYGWAIAAATTYGDLIEATFDLYRHLLYESLRWNLPPDPNEEHRVGRQLTEYLWRGF